MITLLLLGLLLLGTSVALAVRALVPPSESARRLERIAAYGYGGDAALASQQRVPAMGADVGGTSQLMGRLGDAIGRRFGRVREAEVRAELMSAGMYTTSPAALVGYRLVAALVLGGLLIAVAAVGDSPLLFGALAVFGAATGWMAPLVYVRRRARHRRARIDRELPDLIDLLVVTMEAGLGFSGSLRVAAREVKGPLGDELRLTLQEEAMGLNLTEALSHLLERCDTPAMRSFVRSVVQGETLGVSIGTVMRNLAVETRKRRRSTAEERAQKAPIKLLFPLVFLIFPSVFIVLLLPALLQLRDAFA